MWKISGSLNRGILGADEHGGRLRCVSPKWGGGGGKSIGDKKFTFSEKGGRADKGEDTDVGGAQYPAGKWGAEKPP